MRDTEYRDALIEMISEFNKDIFIEIADANGGGRDAVILTDIRPEEIESDVLMRMSVRTVFITSVRSSDEPDDADRAYEIHRVFKYSGIQEIISKVSVVYSEWTGDSGNAVTLSRCAAVCGESDLESSARCMELARQIIYRHGGSILILPLGYINDYASDCEDNCFARLIYMTSNGREYPAEGYTRTDSYGISYIRMKEGLNPVAELGGTHLNRLIASLGSRFDTLIFDIGSCYRKENVEIIRKADGVIWIGSGRRVKSLESLIGGTIRGRLHRIAIGSDGITELDDLVREMYGDGSHAGTARA